MTGYKFGDIILVPFPFTDQSAVKRRPAVVISSTAYHRTRPDIVIMAVTSQLPTTLSVGEVQVQDWRGAGLLKPSVLKPVLTTIDPHPHFEKARTAHTFRSNSPATSTRPNYRLIT
jgi:mRNA interferase MazF